MPADSTSIRPAVQRTAVSTMDQVAGYGSIHVLKRIAASVLPSGRGCRYSVGRCQAQMGMESGHIPRCGRFFVTFVFHDPCLLGACIEAWIFLELLLSESVSGILHRSRFRKPASKPCLSPIQKIIWQTPVL